MQIKCIRLCLDLPHRSHIGGTHFEKTYWLLVSRRVESCIATTVFEYWNGIVPSYINDMFKPPLIGIMVDCKNTIRFISI